MQPHSDRSRVNVAFENEFALGSETTLDTACAGAVVSGRLRHKRSPEPAPSFSSLEQLKAAETAPQTEANSEECESDFVDDHCHFRPLKAHENHNAQARLVIVIGLCVLFMIVELVGGTIAGSLAIMTDAAHMLSDVAGFVIAYFAIWIGKRPATRSFTFGFYRFDRLYVCGDGFFTLPLEDRLHCRLNRLRLCLAAHLAFDDEILGALLSIFIIWTMTAVLVYLAVLRVIDRDYYIDADAMLITASCGVVFNMIIGCVLHRCGVDGHSHGDFSSSDIPAEQDFSPAIGHNDRVSIVGAGAGAAGTSVVQFPEMLKKKKPADNINIRAATMHILGDFVQSVGVLVGASLIKVNSEWKLADPICTFIFSLMVIATTVKVFRDVIWTLLETVPLDFAYKKLEADLRRIQGVRAIHDLHVWALTVGKVVINAHLAVDADHEFYEVQCEASRLLRFKYHAWYSTVQVEPYDRHIMAICKECSSLER
ncbi:Zinc transporter 2 [Trichinella britovi]|uniref:Zinc transporter 2 n=1 Tax=Trichinella britovi TaxID=45882 RepID=A0A0V1CTM5_TRIBR|nr:Zinc transporter 2 [Trichinella britovi]